MKTPFLIAILIVFSSILLAQTIIKKGDNTKIRITYDGTDDHDFLIDVDINQNTAKITYISYDSIRFKKVKNDPQYQDLNKRIYTYKNNDLKSKFAWDTLGKIFEKYRGYTRDSKNINLTKDTIYRNLLNRILTASKDELSPDINANAKITGRYIITTTEGTSFNLAIVTPTGKRSIPAHLPELNENPLLFNLLKTSLSKKPGSKTVKNILKYYPSYK